MRKIVIRNIATHLLALYLGAGLSLGLIMGQVLPLSAIGIGVYTATWPHHVYCARPGANCFGLMETYPDWLGKLMFNLEAAPAAASATKE